MARHIIFTIGHSTHSIEYFLELLKSHAVTCVVDVRSIAASRFNPQYNKKRLADFLSLHHISYLHFAEEFGARQTDPDLLDENDQVDFEKVRASQTFRQGMDRLKAGIGKNYTIALMCAESNPLECHRFSMISVALQEEGYDVMHILKDKTVKSNSELEVELMRKFTLKGRASSLFKPVFSDQLKEAYRLINREIGYSASKTKS